MKKETLEEVAEKYIPKSKRWTIKDIFKDGAKWQQERICIDIEQKWNEYIEIYLNNEDGWSFKEWLVKELTIK